MAGSTGSTWLQGYRAFWVYTLARFALFGVLWLVLWLVGVPWLFAALIAAVVSVPLSLVLLAKPRQAFAATIESRVNDRHAKQEDLGRRLDAAASDADPGSDSGSDSDSDAAAAAPLPPGVSESPTRGRSKRR